MANLIEDYTSSDFHKQSLECLIRHLRKEDVYDQATLDLALEKSEYPFQILVPFEDIKLIISLLNRKEGEEDRVSRSLISRVLKLPQVKECVKNYKLHVVIGTPISEIDKLFFNFSCTFYPLVSGLREELLHLDMVAKATLAVNRVSEEFVQNLSEQMKDALKENKPMPIAPQAVPPPPPPAPKSAPPKKEDVFDSTKKVIDNLFNFKSPQEKDKLIENVIGEFILLEESKNHGPDLEKLTREFQEDKIADLLFRIVTAYLPEGVKDEAFISALKNFLKEAGKCLFFTTPRNINGADKAKLDLILNKVIGFFNMVEKRTDYMNENELSLETIDERLLATIIRIVRKIKSKKLFNPKETAIESLGVWLISYTAFKVIIQIFSPLTFLNIIHRLLDQPIDLNSLEQNEPSLDFFSINDEHYCRMVGAKVKEIATKVVGMGLNKPSLLINVIFNYFTPERIGVVVTQVYNRTLNSSCSMKPVLLAHHVLLKEGKPIFPAKEAPPHSLSTRMVRDIYPLVKKMIDQEAGGFSGLAAWLSDIEPMLLTLGLNLDKIFNDPLTLKLLAHLILVEIDKQMSLTDP